MTKLFLNLAFLAVPLMAGEYAVLATGFRIPAERHEVSGPVVRLFLKSGVTELPAATVVTFEADDYVAPQIGRAHV